MKSIALKLLPPNIVGCNAVKCEKFDNGGNNGGKMVVGCVDKRGIDDVSCVTLECECVCEPVGSKKRRSSLVPNMPKCLIWFCSSAVGVNLNSIGGAK